MFGIGVFGKHYNTYTAQTRLASYKDLFSTARGLTRSWMQRLRLELRQSASTCREPIGISEVRKGLESESISLQARVSSGIVLQRGVHRGGGGGGCGGGGGGYG